MCVLLRFSTTNPSSSLLILVNWLLAQRPTIEAPADIPSDGDSEPRHASPNFLTHPLSFFLSLYPSLDRYQWALIIVGFIMNYLFLTTCRSLDVYERYKVLLCFPFASYFQDAVMFLLLNILVPFLMFYRKRGYPSFSFPVLIPTFRRLHPLLSVIASPSPSHKLAVSNTSVWYYPIGTFTPLSSSFLTFSSISFSPSPGGVQKSPVSSPQWDEHSV